MTLQPYDAERLDHLALELLDLAAIARDMAKICRDTGIDSFPLHDKKAQQWSGNLDRWLRRARAELEMTAIEARATQQAKAATRCGKR
ncbi:MAG TPA: hypothetical protein VJL29_02700 [Thermoguttaceae bacterium]|nr:hypothetical protein [Thermoguttaceae bacterium]